MPAPPMPRARPRSRIPTFGKTGPIHFAAPICAWSAEPHGIGSARHCVSSLPTWSCAAATASASTGRWPIPILRPGTTWPKPSSACRVTTPTGSDRRVKSHIPCRDYPPPWATGWWIRLPAPSVSRCGYRRRRETRSLSTDGPPAAPARHAFRFARCRPSTMRPCICGRRRPPAPASLRTPSRYAWTWDPMASS